MITALGKVAKNNNVEAIQLDFASQAIIDILKDGALHFDEILQRSSMNIAELSGILSQLEILGAIRKLQGNNFEIIPLI